MDPDVLVLLGYGLGLAVLELHILVVSQLLIGHSYLEAHPDVGCDEPIVECTAG